MPHCILEYSENLKDKIDNPAILKNIHDVLIATKLFSLNDIKSRAILQRDYLVGDGNPERAFVSLTISFLSGKDETLRKEISRKCLEILKKSFPQSRKELKLSITVEIRELDKETYLRDKNY
jgi:5-carboxymethyl-2-hydroxymuconate isomerase